MQAARIHWQMNASKRRNVLGEILVFNTLTFVQNPRQKPHLQSLTLHPDHRLALSLTIQLW